MNFFQKSKEKHRKRGIYFMKQNNKRFFLATAGVITIGTAALAFSTVQAKEQIAKELSSKTEMNQTITSSDITKNSSTNVDKKVAQATAGVGITKNEQDASNQKKNFITSENFTYIPFYDDEKYVENNKEFDFAQYTYAYRGQVILINDDLVDKSTKKKNAEKVVDCIFDILQPNLFKQLQIDVEDYVLSLHRQYDISDHTYYNVCFEKNNQVFVSVLVDMENKAIINFTRDGLIDYTDFDKVEEKYKVDTWSEQKKTEVYEKFLPQAQDILNSKMNFPTIMDGAYDPTNENYISGDGVDALISLGYQLENGMFVKLIFDQVSMDWDGFVMLGCDTKLLHSSTFNKTKEGKALLERYGFSEFYISKN